MNAGKHCGKPTPTPTPKTAEKSMMQEAVEFVAEHEQTAPLDAVSQLYGIIRKLRESDRRLRAEALRERVMSARGTHPDEGGDRGTA